MHGFGDPDVLSVDWVPVPEPGPHEVLVRVLATTINHRDLWIRSGHAHAAYHVELPGVVGVVVCGEVVRVCAQVQPLAPGDRIVNHPHGVCYRCPSCRQARFAYCTGGLVYRGSYAEYALVPAEQAIPIAPGVPETAAACFPNAYVTAWQMLIGKAVIGPGDTLFDWAGTSGLGSAAIEIGRLAGARVLASAGSDAKLAVLAGRGPDLCLDHRRDDVVAQVLDATGGLGATVVFEHVGAATWERSLGLCAPGGVIVSAGATSGDLARLDVTAMFAKQLRILGSRVGTLEDSYNAVRHLNSGVFQPLIDRVLGLDDVADGHRRLAAGGVIGKIVVCP
jgi:NADPH:quinone reductase-like Zn-dependent oxidoreductase